MVDLNILYLFEMLRKCSAGASNSPSNALKQDGPFDVIIIGAGAAGLAAARLLLKCNKQNPCQTKLRILLMENSACQLSFFEALMHFMLSTINNVI